MVKDRQVKRLFRLLSSGKALAQAADKAGMDEKTARKHREPGRLPSEVGSERTWRTRLDPFTEVWPEVHEQLQESPGLEAKTLFAWLKTKYPEKKFDDSQLRTFQRGIKRWRATSGPAEGSVLQPGPFARPLVRFGLHAHEEPARFMDNHSRIGQSVTPGCGIVVLSINRSAYRLSS